LRNQPATAHPTEKNRRRALQHDRAVVEDVVEIDLPIHHARGILAVRSGDDIRVIVGGRVRADLKRHAGIDEEDRRIDACDAEIVPRARIRRFRHDLDLSIVRQREGARSGDDPRARVLWPAFRNQPQSPLSGND
jgi:hypothetical protein